MNSNDFLIGFEATGGISEEGYAESAQKSRTLHRNCLIQLSRECVFCPSSTYTFFLLKRHGRQLWVSRLKVVEKRSLRCARSNKAGAFSCHTSADTAVATRVRTTFFYLTISILLSISSHELSTDMIVQLRSKKDAIEYIG
jgi:hypothetical protein